MPEIKTNILYYGDNLDILREHIHDESIDLIYLDPPFNSKRTYNVLFRESSGAASEAQIEAFEDSWHWGDSTMRAYDDVMRSSRQDVAKLLGAMVEGLGHNDVTAYLVMMAVRLVELHRLLKPTGSIYLHCDPTASHYLKIVLDAIFNPRNFRNEIIWHYSGWNKKLKSRIESRHDIILLYCKKQGATFNYPTSKWSSKEEYVRTRKQKINIEKNGREYVLSDAGAGKRTKRFIDDAMAYGRPLDDVFQIDKLTSGEKEYLGYDTQKPVRLLQRIIEIGSNPDDIILDPFCGCGTAVHAAQKLERRWIGIDITYLAINLIERRMQDAFAGIEIETIGAPIDLASARDLACRDKWQFQWWGLTRIDAQPVAGKKKGADRGIDGVIPFFAGPTEDYKRAIVSVKGGENVSVRDIRDLVGVLDRENEPVGIFLTLTPPTKPMITEAAAAGFYESEFWGRKFPRIQILTIEEMFDGKRLNLPWGKTPFVNAQREKGKDNQISIDIKDGNGRET